MNALDCARPVLVAALAAGLIPSGPAFGTDAAAIVRGRVVDSTGSPVPGAAVSLRRDADSFLTSERTQTDGRFALEALPGEFELSASAPGFSVTRAQVRLGTRVVRGRAAEVLAVVEHHGLAGDRPLQARALDEVEGVLAGAADDVLDVCGDDEVAREVEVREQGTQRPQVA